MPIKQKILAALAILAGIPLYLVINNLWGLTIGSVVGLILLLLPSRLFRG